MRDANHWVIVVGFITTSVLVGCGPTGETDDDPITVVSESESDVGQDSDVSTERDSANAPTRSAPDTGTGSGDDTEIDTGSPSKLRDTGVDTRQRVDTSREVDTSEPEPQRVEGPLDASTHRCSEICADASLTCTPSCTNDDGEQVAGVVQYLTNVSGETYNLPHDIDSCEESIPYSKSRRVRRGYWCCCR